MKAHFGNYSTFYGLFRTIFVLKEYSFTAKKDPVIIDCGSNIGMSILYFKKYFPGAKITAFEPNPGAFLLLQKNISCNGLKDITAVNAALTDKETMVSFYVEKDDDFSLGSSLTNRLQVKGKEQEKITVRGVKLSSYVDTSVDLLKIDIEGSEQEVLEELDKEDKLRYVNEMIVEYHFDHMDTKNLLENVLEILHKNSFEYVIRSKKDAPLNLYKLKPYNLIIFAYKRDSTRNLI